MAAGALAPIIHWAVTVAGLPVAGAKLYTALSGTDTPSPVYQDAALTIPHSNPVVADSNGVFPAFWLGARAYRFSVTTSVGVTVFAALDHVYDFGQLLAAGGVDFTTTGQTWTFNSTHVGGGKIRLQQSGDTKLELGQGAAGATGSGVGLDATDGALTVQSNGVLTVFANGINTNLTLGATGDTVIGGQTVAINTLNGVDVSGDLRTTAGLYERGRSVALGDWTPVTFSAGNFTGAGSMTWTVESGDVTAFRWSLVGTTMRIFLDLRDTVIGGTPSAALNIVIPGGKIPALAAASYTPIRIVENSTPAWGMAIALNTGTLQIYRTPGGADNWTAGSANVQGTVEFEVNP